MQTIKKATVFNENNLKKKLSEKNYIFILDNYFSH